MKTLRRFLEQRPIAGAVTYTVVGVLPLYLTSAQTTRLQAELGFGKTEFGIMVAAFYLASSIGSRRIGPVLDRGGPSRGFRGSALLTVASASLIAVAGRGWVTLALFLAIAGLANSFGQIASNLAIAEVVRRGKQGFAFSAKQAAVPTGAMLAGLVVPWMGVDLSWRVIYGIAALIAAGLVLIVPRYDLVPRLDATEKTRLTAPLVYLMVAAALAGGIGNSVASFVADAAVTTGFSSGTAARLLTLGSVVAILTRITAGMAADRRAKTGVAEMTALMILAVLGLLVLSVATEFPSIFIAGVVLSFAGAWGWQGVMFYTVIRTIPMPAATSTGAVASAAYFGTVTLPPLVGAVAEGMSYAAVFTGAAALIALSMAAIHMGRRLALAAAR